MTLYNEPNIWTSRLNRAKYVVAPMVERSELSWRLLCRRHGAQLCYTPMFHASLFVRDYKYRRENFVTCPEDRPLIVQFCANNPDTFVEAAKMVAPYCDAVDLNLGCPQVIAKKGHYGAFLQDEWDLIETIVSKARKEVDIPITCKVRVFSDIKKTIQYAQMLERAGCQLLTVHGRERAQKGPLTGTASWDHIKAVKANVSIPVFANGNVQYLSDVHRCIKETGVNGVMSAEGILHNPFLFQGLNPPIWEAAFEFLQLVKQYPSPTSFTRGHLFKLFHHCLVRPEFLEIREKLAKAPTTDDFIAVTCELRDHVMELQEILVNTHLPFPPWICQPYVRPSSSLENQENKKVGAEEKHSHKRILNINGTEHLSKKKLKKLQRNNGTKSFEKGKRYEPCSNNCPNPRGTKCCFSRCKGCCKEKASRESLDCSGHKFFYATKKDKLPLKESL